MQFCQCINCLFPILRAYGTVLRLGAPGTDCQGINIGDVHCSVVLLLEGAIYMWNNSSLITFILFLSLLNTCPFDRPSSCMFRLKCLLLPSPSLCRVFTLFPSSSFLASFLPNFHPGLAASYFLLSAIPLGPVDFC